MPNIPMEELLGKTGSIYKLVILASKRAVELNAGAGKLIEASPYLKLSTIALEEIRQGKVKIKKKAEEKKK
ncbi:MAG: DNA-directed RNA polymerase subunit omega [Candidatus Omnitrophica bacterium]|nr:DNA-directed RNA polymerase subunit omega [Candidatus Omnitrophota bacterium]